MKNGFAKTHHQRAQQYCNKQHPNSAKKAFGAPRKYKDTPKVRTDIKCFMHLCAYIITAF